MAGLALSIEFGIIAFFVVAIIVLIVTQYRKKQEETFEKREN